MDKSAVIKHILRNTNPTVNNKGGYAYAPSNIALCKYWGKRDASLKLPVTSSLSLSLGTKGAFTHIEHNTQADNFTLNNTPISPQSKFAQRLSAFLDLLRPPQVCYTVTIYSTVPIAAGLASSACGFASLVQALNNLYHWQLPKTELSILARLGSGSACRSLWDGFVTWQAGTDPNGFDSHGIPLPYMWPTCRLGVVMISRHEKAISSTEAMQLTVAAPSYQTWPQQVAKDLSTLERALEQQDFPLLGSTMERNALAMHAMLPPPISYSLPLTYQAIQQVHKLRTQGIPVYFTQDAGPNLQLLFLEEHTQKIVEAFPNLDIVVPFPQCHDITLVDENDQAIAGYEKLAAHLQGKLHRAFSVFILRRSGNDLELLLQQRSATKYHSPNLWTNTCCGHPKLGENTKTAAQQRLQFEMGITAELTEIGVFQYTAILNNGTIFENEIDHVLIGFSKQTEFLVNSAEVQNYRWLPLTSCYQEVLANPQQFTAWLAQALTIVMQQT